MYKVLVFAGTTEGRKIAEYLNRCQINAYVSVVTSYGESLLPKGGSLCILHRRMNQEEMCAFIQEKEISIVIDATHPYAAEVTRNIRQACESTNSFYVRLLRKSAEMGAKAADVVYVNSVEEAVDFLEGTDGNILVTTGSKELHKFTHLKNYKDRVYARVLSLPKVAASCAALGFEGKHLICMQGPFSLELNLALLKQYECTYLVTKESGTQGGFVEKYEAARRGGCRLVVIGRPIEEEGLSLEECKCLLKTELGFVTKPRIVLVGIGMGSEATFTVEAKRTFLESDLIIGAKRMLDAVLQAGFADGEACTFQAYDSEVIASYIETHPHFERIAIALSGDVGYYSGAKKLYAALNARGFSDVSAVCGISCGVYFMAKIQKSWEDVRMTSVHGRTENLIALIEEQEKVFSILGDSQAVAELSKKLLLYGMEDVILYIGENLSYPKEKIVKGSPKDFLTYQADPLGVIYIENPRAAFKAATHGMPDEAFLRDRVPMTKEEVRSISLSKLRLTRNAVCYDVGAGTGSVAVEIAKVTTGGRVYAIEKKGLAVELLRKNKVHQKADNLVIIEGTAPHALEGLEAPTHAFIGGSSGNLKEIMELLLKKNPRIRMVINAISLETVAESVRCLKELPVTEVEVVQASISRAKELGNYHMMMGENPIYIISCCGGV